MGRINWRNTLQMRGIDPDTFKEEFEEKLHQPNVIEELLQLATFRAMYHNVTDCDDGQCSECYSGDTEFEMNHGCGSLENIWKEIYEDLMEDVYNDSSDSADEDEESSEKMPTPQKPKPTQKSTQKIKKI